MAIADNQTFQADWSALGADLEIVPGPDSTMAAAFLQAVEMRGDRVALRSKDRGLWQAFSWRDYGKQVRRIALALIARAAERMTVSKTGFEETMSNFAHNQALIYGLICVVLGVTIGWLAGVIFRRD